MLGMDILKARMQGTGVNAATPTSGIESIMKMMGLDPEALKAQAIAGMDAAKARLAAIEFKVDCIDVNVTAIRAQRIEIMDHLRELATRIEAIEKQQVQNAEQNDEIIALLNGDTLEEKDDAI